MKSKTHLNELRVWLALASASIASTAESAESEPTLIVVRRVHNPALQAYFNANVWRESPGKSAYSESNVTFRFSRVLAGFATLTVTLTGNYPQWVTALGIAMEPFATSP